jgi:hypothetical protein
MMIYISKMSINRANHPVAITKNFLNLIHHNFEKGIQIMRFPNQSAGVIRTNFAVYADGSPGHIFSSQLFCTDCGPVAPTDCIDSNTGSLSKSTCVQRCSDPATGEVRVMCCPPERCDQSPPPKDCCKQVCCEARVV